MPSDLKCCATSMIPEIRKRLKTGRSVATWQVLSLHATGWMMALLLPSLLLVSFSSAAARQAGDLEATIQHLIAYVRTSDVMFERNFTRHDAAQAAAHIEKKYQHYRDTIESPEQFIKLCATASLVTGMPYTVIDGQGNELPAAEWLNTELIRYRFQNAQQ